MDPWLEEMEEDEIPMRDSGVAQEEALEESTGGGRRRRLGRLRRQLRPIPAKVDLVPEVPPKVDPAPEEPIILPVAGADARRLRTAQQWCTSEPAAIACQDGETVEVYGALYNRRPADCEPAKRTAAPLCHPNAIDVLRKACSGGKQVRTVSPSTQRYCERAPYTFLGVVWDCVGGASPSDRHARHGRVPQR
uniref:SUEL-type lectin domain-containing protein n=1 Tax=Alexandrium monilatum TaxID=311494 RepID=A0A7S4Q1M2_9DINO